MSLELVPPIIIVFAEDNMSDSGRSVLEGFHEKYILIQMTYPEALMILRSDFNNELVQKILELPEQERRQALKLAALHHYGGVLVDGRATMLGNVDKLRTYPAYIAQQPDSRISQLVLAGTTRSPFWKEVLLTYSQFLETTNRVANGNAALHIQSVKCVLNVAPYVALMT